MRIEDLPGFAELKAAIDAELADESWGKATHGTAYLYNKGCHGPVCRRANQLRKRPGGRIPLEYGYIELREAEYLEERRKQKAEQVAKVRPPGTTRVDWVEKAMSTGRKAAS